MVEKEPGILGWIASLAPWAVGHDDYAIGADTAVSQTNNPTL